MKNNVINITDRIKEKQRKQQNEEYLEQYLDETDGEWEIIFTPIFAPSNDNSIFVGILDEYIPETIEGYEKLYGDTFGKEDYGDSSWYKTDPDTGEVLYD